MELDGHLSIGVEAGAGFPCRVQVNMIASKRSEDQQFPKVFEQNTRDIAGQKRMRVVRTLKRKKHSSEV